jgi:hypothetical protein
MNDEKVFGHAAKIGGMLDAGYWILDTGYWILDAGYWILDAGCWMQDERQEMKVVSQ